jgi:hypothetical protein
MKILWIVVDCGIEFIGVQDLVMVKFFDKLTKLISLIFLYLFIYLIYLYIYIFFDN